jgi:hypothetical protein
VKVNGHVLRLGGELGIRGKLNGHIIYGTVTQIIYAFVHTTKHALFVEVEPRTIYGGDASPTSVGRPMRPKVYLNANTDLTHLVKFVPNPTSNSGRHLALKVWATTPQWT